MRKVPIGNSLAWIRDAFATVGGHPLEFVTMGLIMATIAMIPLLGFLTLLFLGPALIGGMIYAAGENAHGRKPQVGQLFRVFQEGERLGSFVALCLPIVIGAFVLLLFAIPLVVYAMHNGLLSEQMRSDPVAMNAALKQLLFHHRAGMLYLAVMLIVLFLVEMTTFLAIPAVMLRRKRASEAIRLSFSACRRNLGAFLVALLLFGAALQVLAHVLDLFLPGLWASYLASMCYYTLLGPLSHAMFVDIFGDAGAADVSADAAPGDTFEA